MDLTNFKIKLTDRNLDTAKYDYVASLFINGILEAMVDTKIGERRIRAEGRDVVVSFVKSATHRIYPDHLRVEIIEVERGAKGSMMRGTLFCNEIYVINEAVKTNKKDSRMEFWDSGFFVFNHDDQSFEDEGVEEEESEEEESDMEEAGSSEESEDSEPKTTSASTRSRSTTAKKSSTPTKPKSK